MTGENSRAAGPVITVPDAALSDLRERLGRVRWPEAWPAWDAPPWSAGAPAGVVRELAEYWRDTYDWRSHEHAINELPWAVADIDGVALHFLVFEAEQDGNLPIVVTNGWPSTFYEMIDLAKRLSAPSRFGRPADAAATVVIPCLPGFPFTPQQPQLPAAPATHELWHRLMHDTLGFARYVAHGGDLGSGVTSLLAQNYPDQVAGIHLMSIADPPQYDTATLTDSEVAYLDSARRWLAVEGAYEHQQWTRPATLAYGLSDSPVGLLAWIVEKYYQWSDNDGTLGSVFSADDILTHVSLYWFTNCISTSFRPYFEPYHGLRQKVSRVVVPTAVAVFPKDLVRPPRSWAERTYNVVRYTQMPRGGHFAPHEAPDLLADDIGSFGRGLS